MSGLAEFKEKTFEKYFCIELARHTNITFSPDQYDEWFLGFDDALYLPWRLDLFPWLPYVRQRRRQRLSGISIREIDDLAVDASRRMPWFKFNLFIQYKRPEYIDHHRGKEWTCWRSPYFRFDITPHQQKLLSDLELHARGRAIPVYSAASFWQSSDLYTHAENGTVVANSNVANAARLNGHRRFSYKEPGSFGRGHSDPVDIESSTIFQIIEQSIRNEELPLDRHIGRLALEIDAAVALNEPQAYLFDRVRRIILGEDAGIVAEKGVASFTYSLATIDAFSELAGVSYYAMG